MFLADLSRYKFWDTSIAADPPSVPYDEVMATDAGVGKMLSKTVICPAQYPSLY